MKAANNQIEPSPEQVNRLLNQSFGSRQARREWERKEIKRILRTNKVEA